MNYVKNTGISNHAPFFNLSIVKANNCPDSLEILASSNNVFIRKRLRLYQFGQQYEG